MPDFMLTTYTGYSLAWLSTFDKINQESIAGYQQCKHTPNRQTHFFNQRYENTMIKADRIALLPCLLSTARDIAATLLITEPEHLKCGLWFNAMEPGAVTTKHSHDNDDEILSCVYYVDVSRYSGELILSINGSDIVIRSQSGMFVFFSPALVHEVTKNISDGLRLSVAMNFAYKDTEGMADT